MKQELLEYLIRHCVKEVISQVNEEDPTMGAPAPPEAGQGTADTPEIPKDKDTTPEPPSQPETPPTPQVKGIVLINPMDKANLKPVTLRGKDDASLERELYTQARGIAGRNVKVSLSTRRSVKDSLKNPSAPMFLYFGKFDPASDEIFLMADKSLQVAKDSSVDPTEIKGTSKSVPVINPVDRPTTPDEEDAEYIQSVPKMYGAQGPEVVAPDDSETNDQIDEIKLLVKKMVNEVLNTK